MVQYPTVLYLMHLFLYSSSLHVSKHSTFVSSAVTDSPPIVFLDLGLNFDNSDNSMVDFKDIPDVQQKENEMV